jgi:hypothetical protein
VPLCPPQIPYGLTQTKFNWIQALTSYLFTDPSPWYPSIYAYVTQVIFCLQISLLNLFILLLSPCACYMLRPPHSP